MRTAWPVLILAALVIAQIAVANAGLATTRLLFGGSGSDDASGIAVDPNYIYLVGTTTSFGPNPPNLLLSIFRLDNSHKCSVAVDLGGGEQGFKVVARGGSIYALGQTSLGTDPPNILLVKFDTSCNVLGSAVYNVDGVDNPFGLAISDDGSTLYISGYSTSAAHLLAVSASTLSVSWARLVKVSGGGDAIYSVTFSGDKLYLTGRTDTNDLFISRFDATTGNHDLTKVFATPQGEAGLDIAVSAGKVYVAGYADDDDFLLMRLDVASLSVDWSKLVSTPSPEKLNAVSILGGLVYAVGDTSVFGTPDAPVIAVRASDGELSHAFLIVEGGSAQAAYDAAISGSCLIFTGTSGNWPVYYFVFDGLSVGSISFTISSPTPLIANPSPAPISHAVTTTPFTPSINTPASTDAFYSWFCPDTLVVSTTTTTTSLTTATLSTTLTSTIQTTVTAYDIRSTTITQTSVTTRTDAVTATLTTTSTQTETLRTTMTRTETTTLSTTYTTATTFSTTETYKTTLTSTQYFAEPLSTYALPALLAVIAVLLGVSLISRRRRKLLSY
ncbi:hypothetical protein HRbin02_01206 [Candidatus Calditenuaceae archaeon HR02]|nr:hypothetical protein HRbin02_01206 [Candidatus Calditenuaceae archaeon HR02]